MSLMLCSHGYNLPMACSFVESPHRRRVYVILPGVDLEPVAQIMGNACVCESVLAPRCHCTPYNNLSISFDNQTNTYIYIYIYIVFFREPNNLSCKL